LNSRLLQAQKAQPQGASSALVLPKLLRQLSTSYPERTTSYPRAL
jgi:hypothetical protein